MKPTKQQIENLLNDTLALNKKLGLPKNNFLEGCKNNFDRYGILTEKQLDSINRTRLSLETRSEKGFD